MFPPPQPHMRSKDFWTKALLVTPSDLLPSDLESLFSSLMADLLAIVRAQLVTSSILHDMRLLPLYYYNCFLPSFPPLFLPSFLLSFLFSFFSASLPSFFLSSLPPYFLPFFLSFFLSSFLPPFLPSFLPS